MYNSSCYIREVKITINKIDDSSLPPSLLYLIETHSSFVYISFTERDQTRNNTRITPTRTVAKSFTSSATTYEASQTKTLELPTLIHDTKMSSAALEADYEYNNESSSRTIDIPVKESHYLT